MTVIAVKEYLGSTSAFYQVEDGMVIKSLHKVFAQQDAYKVTVERQILERLGEHPRIVQYKGFRDDPDLRGLLFVEASHGSLQNYIDRYNDTIEPSTRKIWCQQATEAIQYIHSKGVIHSDLRPENMLVQKSSSSLDLLLCDFGGSMCEELNLDGKGLPDPPFWNLEWESTIDTDLFSLGSIFFTVITGRWPYKFMNQEEEEKAETNLEFGDRVVDLMKQGFYPDVEGVTSGVVMMGCWKKRYVSAEEVLEAFNSAWPGEIGIS